MADEVSPKKSYKSEKMFSQQQEEKKPTMKQSLNDTINDDSNEVHESSNQKLR